MVMFGGEITKGVDWSYFGENPRLERETIHDRYFVPVGEGETMATQIVTAINKLVYHWYNDGDVYDNTHLVRNGCEDQSSYANWLYKYIGADVLMRISEIDTGGEYEQILKELYDKYFTLAVLDEYSAMPKVGSIYDCAGPFKCCNSMTDWDDEDENEDEEYEA